MISKKPRCDAWDARLDEAQRWVVYRKMKEFAWEDVQAFVSAEYHEKPSRSSLYAFAARLRKDESAHRIEQSITAAAEAGQLARVVATDEKLIAAYQSMAADIALRTGDAKTAERYTKMALNIAKGLRADKQLDLKSKELELAKNKFAAAEARLNAVRDAIATAKTGSGGLTPEALKQIEEAAGLL